MKIQINTLLIIAIVIILIYMIITITINIKKKYYINSNHINILSRQAARWSIASKQDTNPIISTLHANYGAGYLWALLDIYKESEIEKATGINMTKFKKEITNTQDNATKKLIKNCPKILPTKSYLTSIAGHT
jgi:hypothetical protein